MQIATQQATIKTAEISIKTLTLKNKQVTLAVFRQLDQADIIDEDSCKMNGIAWGRINYHPDKCGNKSEHIHIVWQKDNFLYRNTIYKRVELNEHLTRLHESLEDSASALINYGGDIEDRKLIQSWKPYRNYFGSRIRSDAEFRANELSFYQTAEFFEKRKAEREKTLTSIYENLLQLDLLFIAV
ncbi:MAG: hypothetical protein ACR2MD_01830 [Aridibacter sp.]